MATKASSRARSTRKGTARTSARRSVGAKALDQVGKHFGERAEELSGFALVVLAVLAAFGLWGDVAAGPFGEAIDRAARTAMGPAANALPPLLAVVGAALLLGLPKGEPLRVAVGAIFLAVGGMGLLHVARTGSEMGFGLSDTEALRSVAGVGGAAIGEPLQRGLGGWGSAVVLGAVSLLGVLLAANLSLRDSLMALGAGGRWVWDRLLGIGRLPESEDDGTDDAATTRPARATVIDLAEDAEGRSVDLDDIQDAEIVDETVAEDDVDHDGGAREPVVHAEVHVPDDVPTGEQLALIEGSAVAWKLPPLKLLHAGKVRPIDRGAVEDGGRVLEATLRDFGVEASVTGMTIGPTVTRYEVELAPGVKVNRVTSLSKDIAYAMASPDVRILAPIPGKSAIGVEVPNRQRQLVALGDLMGSAEAREMSHPLEVILGRDISGKPHRVNLAEMPHLLIAGATGAGKSSCINSLITGLAMRNTPEQLRLILVDPKRVELGAYNDLPHLLSPVVVDPKKAANALAWAVREMERRYEILAHHGCRDITGYQAAIAKGEINGTRVVSSDPDKAVETKPPEHLPFMLIVVDELNDLMMVAARDVEASICRIAQMARAVGIHLIVATQRPSVDVITGVIKANIPSRLAFSVSSLADSRVILDAAGAEKLIGQGDMLMLGGSSSRVHRIQGAWVEESEVRKVVAHWKKQAEEPDYVHDIGDDGNVAHVLTHSGGGGGGTDEGDDESLVREAMELVVRTQLGSTSMLQRKLRIGFARAGRVMDILEERGVVGPSLGSKARDVLMAKDELEDLSARSDS
ncbi:MAG TPA: DNA translocase FtsK [Acidimicrobiia bacterium]|nr:DNA translocase FtsK [Acidimicrobiia bacterium]